MAFYNAIILDKGKRIIGRTHVTDLSTFLSPQSNWIVRYGCANLRADVPLESILSGPNNLFVISKSNPVSSQFINVKVITLTGKTFPFTITEETNVDDLKEMIRNVEGISPDQQLLIRDNRQLENGNLLIDDYGIQDGDRIHLILRLRGGGFELINLEGTRETGVGRPLDPNYEATWMGYSAGFNIIGKCENPECDSRNDGRRPIKTCGFGQLRITGDLHYCPACNSKSLKALNLLVAGARSAINFRKTGEVQIKSTLLESPGEYPKYVKLAEGNEGVEYDEVEVRTCRLDGSPFFCYGCIRYIMGRDSEVGMPCGHYFHQSCAKKFKDCPICKAGFVIEKGIEELFEL